MTSELLADVYISPAVSMRRPDGQIIGTWSPIACTLIHGPTSAVLINAPFTTAETESLADWLTSTLGKNKKLKAVYISHGVHDFLLGLPTLRKHFPNIKTFCTQETLDAIKQSLQPKVLAAFAAQFPGQIDQQPPIEQAAELLPPNNQLEIDGHVLQAIVAGQGAVPNSTIIWVPSLRLAVCGTIAYGSVHLMQAGTATKEKRNAWIAAIEKVEKLGPTSVVPAHQKPGEIQGVWHLQRTKEYLKKFGGLVESGQVKDAKELAAAMMKEYPDRLNSGALIVSSRAALPRKGRL
jgi:glyoxylase-like metal-dependent hydrolase (beta-lactamase superfamily II)